MDTLTPFVLRLNELHGEPGALGVQFAPFESGPPLNQERRMFDKTQTIAAFDPEIWSSIENEGRRQEEHIELIASENRSEEHTSELQSRGHLVCRLLLE